MALPYDLTGKNIEDTYQRVVQTPDGINYYDGTGSLLPLSGGGSAAPGNPNTSVQFNGNGVFSGSNNFTFNSASDSLTLTGSLNITGSTTQIGNNNLYGNTSLSGSIVISGSTTTPTVQIYGNTTHNGYIRFDPVTTNINQSISASYIYVSGSTQDLYFSQNGSGYSNTTRLRWIEGNMYSGLLNGGLIGSSSSTVFTVSSGSGIIVNLNASYNDNPYPTIQYINWGNLSASIAPLSASFDQQFIAINSSSQIVVQGTPFNDGQFNTLIPIGLILHQNRSTINGVKTSPSVAYGWKQRSSDFIRAFGPLKISGYTVLPSGSSTGSLTVGNGTAFVDGANYAVDSNNPSYIVDNGTTTSKIFRYYQSGSDWVYNTNNGAGYATLDPVYYNPGGLGILDLVGASNYSLQRCYWYPNSVTKAITVYYGNERYGTLAQAIAAIASEPFTEAPNTAANAVYLGTFAIKGGTNTTLQNPAHFTWLPGGLFRGNSGGGGSGGGGGTPGGNNGEIQYNNLGAFGGVPTLTYNGTTLTATGSFSGSLQGTASYASNGGVTGITAGNGISINQSTGNVTITSIAASYNTATGSYGSFYDTTTQTNPVINVPRSMSFNTTDISNGVSISGSTNPYNTYVKVTNAGVYDIQFSAQFDRTTTGTDIVYIWLRKNGVDIPQTNTSIVLTGGAAASPTVAAWNWFVNANVGDYYQLMWSAPDTHIQILASTPPYGPAIPSVIVTANRVDTFLSNTGSFTGSFIGSHTGSFTGSFTGSLFGTASVSNVAYSASIIANNSTNASYLLPFTDRLLSLNSQTGSVQLQTDQNLYYNPLTNQLNVNVSFATSASYASGSTSASYADTASYTISASYAPSSIGPGLTNTLAIWDTNTTIASSSITYLTDASATNQAVVSQSLYNINTDGLKIGKSTDIIQITSSLNSNINVNNISPASNYIQIPSGNPGVIKRLDLFNYNIVDKSGCYGMIIDFSLLLCDKVALEQYQYKFDAGSWPYLDKPYYVETGRIYLSWLGADYDLGGAVGKSGTPNRYITMARTIPNAESSGWDTVPVIPGGIYPTQTSLAASEEGVVAPYGAPVYRDQADGYQFGYKLVNNALGEWYVEVAVWNDTPSNMFITHTTKILTLFTNP